MSNIKKLLLTFPEVLDKIADSENHKILGKAVITTQWVWNAIPNPLQIHRLLIAFLINFLSPNKQLSLHQKIKCIQFSLHKKMKFPEDLVSFTKEVLKGKFYFLCSVVVVNLHIHMNVYILYEEQTFFAR